MLKVGFLDTIRSVNPPNKVRYDPSLAVFRPLLRTDPVIPVESRRRRLVL